MVQVSAEASTMATNRITTPPPPSVGVLPSSNDVLQSLRTDTHLGIHGANPNLHNRVEYFLGGWDRDSLVAKTDADATEFIIRGVFMISRSEFYFTPDANFDPANSFNSKLEDVKLTCRLTPSRDPDFKFSAQDFPIIVENLRKFENLIKKNSDSQSFSVIDSISGMQTIRLSHPLFKVFFFF